jgi:hypothetical protein
MKKLLAIACLILLCGTVVAEAQQRQYQNRGGYSQGYRGNNVYRNNGNRYVQNNYYRGGGYRGYRGGGWNNGGAIAAGVGLGLLGGLIAGSVINQPAYAYPPPVYDSNCQQMWIWDQYGRKVLSMVCQ